MGQRIAEGDSGASADLVAFLHRCADEEERRFTVDGLYIPNGVPKKLRVAAEYITTLTAERDALLARLAPKRRRGPCRFVSYPGGNVCLDHQPGDERCVRSAPDFTEFTSSASGQ